MFDIRLTDSGDISCDMEEPISSFKVSFSLVSYGRQRVSYIISPPSIGTKKRHDQKISFKYIEGFKNYKVQDKAMSELEEAIQAIRIALRTEKNDVRDLDIGSYAYQYQHTLYRNARDLEEIEEYILKVVREILPTATITLEYAADEAAGSFMYQAVKVHLYYEGKQIDEFVF